MLNLSACSHPQSTPFSVSASSSKLDSTLIYTRYVRNAHSIQPPLTTSSIHQAVQPKILKVHLYSSKPAYAQIKVLHPSNLLTKIYNLKNVAS